jgi:hypothetical protein
MKKEIKRVRLSGRQPDFAGTENMLSILCAFQTEVNEFAGMVVV